MTEDWRKVHQWGQDQEYCYYQSCQCSRCKAHYELVAAEQREHIARGELSWISTLPKP